MSRHELVVCWPEWVFPGWRAKAPALRQHATQYKDERDLARLKPEETRLTYLGDWQRHPGIRCEAFQKFADAVVKSERRTRGPLSASLKIQAAGRTTA